MKSVIWKVVLTLSLLLAVVASYNIFKLNREYQAGINEYKGLEQYVTITEAKDTEEQISVEGAEQPDEEILSNSEEQKTMIPIKVDIDFEKLKEMNEELVGWIYYEPLEISYPIVRGNDNEYYTLYTFENVRNSSGAIFMDFLNKPNMDNLNTIIYGHNMRNGTMFGSLKKLLKDTSIIEQDPYFYIYTEDKVFMYEIASSYITNDTSDTFNLIKTEEDQNKYIDYIKEVSEYYWTKEILSTDQIVTLSTCHGLHSKNRTIVHGVLIAQEDR